MMVPPILNTAILIITIVIIYRVLKKWYNKNKEKFIADELLKLNFLRKEGVISEEEFQEQKKKLCCRK